MGFLRRAALFVSLFLTALLGAQGTDPAEPLATAGIAYRRAAALAVLDRNREALPLAREALALREAALGPLAPEVARSLVQVGRLVLREAPGSMAEPLLLRALAQFQALGDAVGEADAADALANVLAERDLLGAEARCARSLALRRVGQDPAGLAQSLATAGTLQLALGRLEEALASLEEALALQPALGSPADAARIRLTLSAVLQHRGELVQAKACLDQALALALAAGNRHLEGLARLEAARTLGERGDWARATGLLEQIRALFLETGSRAGECAAHLELGSGCTAMGDKAKAASHFDRAKDLALAFGWPFREAQALSGLANLHLENREAQPALAAAERSLQLFQAGGNQLNEALAHLRLADVHRFFRRPALALASATRGLALSRACHDQPGVRDGLALLGVVLSGQGKAGAAVGHLEQGLAMARASSSLDREKSILLDLAVCLHAVGRYQEATARFQELIALEESTRAVAFPLLPQAQKLLLSRALEDSRYYFISHVLDTGPEDVQGVRASFDAWLAQKGAVLDVEERTRAAIARSRDPRVRRLAQALTRSRLRLATLSQDPPGAADPTQALKELQAQVQSQERQLALASQRYAGSAAGRGVDAARLAQLLPAGSVYLDYVKLGPLDFKLMEWTASRYVAYILRSGQALPVLVDLGLAEPVEILIKTLHGEMLAARPVAETLATLYGRLVQPLEKHLAGATAFTLSPVGPLHLVPFELLGPLGGPPLLDRGLVGYVTSGLDLARFRAPARGRGGVVVLADPDFDLGLDPAAPRPTAAFPRLPGTRLEAQAIARAFPGRPLLRLQGAAARESALLGISPPWLLHLATHGYFKGEGTIGPGTAGQAMRSQTNPMQRWGLALAGANATLAGQGGGGLFSAEQVLGMDLSRTALVVLSACNTGLGDLKGAEGVIGLRRAFLQAGAQSLLVSLWPVPDAATQDLMAAFYRNLAMGLGKARALQQAKRTLRARRPHPRDWAGFVLVGNPG